MKTLTLRRNFAWNFVGNTVYNLAQSVLMIALAHLGSPLLVGQFALMLAISAPVYMTLGLNLRVVRATDVRRVWKHRQYYQLRLVLNALSFVVTMVLGLALGLRGTGALALAIVALSKAVETTSLMLYGFFQLRERMDLVARSMLVRALLGAVLFVAGLRLTGELWVATAGLLTGWFLTWALHDRRQEQALLASEDEALRRDGIAASEVPSSIFALARTSAPLGLDTGAVSVSTNVPRYAVQLTLGTSGLGHFAALVYLAQVVSTITGSLGDTIVGPLAKQAELHRARSFTRLLFRLLAFASAVTGAAALISWIFGRWAIGLIFGDEYVNQPVLVILMLAVGCITVQRSLARGLQATRQFATLLRVDLAMLVVTVGLAWALVPPFGLVGAAGSLSLGFLAGAVLCGVILSRQVTRMRVDHEEVAAQ